MAIEARISSLDPESRQSLLRSSVRLAINQILERAQNEAKAMGRKAYSITTQARTAVIDTLQKNGVLEVNLNSVISRHFTPRPSLHVSFDQTRVHNIQHNYKLLSKELSKLGIPQNQTLKNDFHQLVKMAGSSSKLFTLRSKFISWLKETVPKKHNQNEDILFHVFMILQQLADIDPTSDKTTLPLAQELIENVSVQDVLELKKSIIKTMREAERSSTPSYHRHSGLTRKEDEQLKLNETQRLLNEIRHNYHHIHQTLRLQQDQEIATIIDQFITDYALITIESINKLLQRLYQTLTPHVTAFGDDISFSTAEYAALESLKMHIEALVNYLVTLKIYAAT